MVLWGASLPLTLRIYSLEFARRLSPLPIAEGTTPAHHIAFAWDGFEESLEDGASSPPPYVELTLAVDEVLFLPRSFVLSLKADADDGPGGILRNCFVDASNIRQFISALSIEAKASASSRALLEAISSADYDASHTAFYMEQSPRDLTLSEYFSNPREIMPSSSSDRRRRQLTFQGNLVYMLIAHRLF